MKTKVTPLEECANLDICNFFKTYEADERLRPVLGGFVRMYCKGEDQDTCVRKAVSKALGGPENVPPNMLPNGRPVLKTDDSDWSAEVNQIDTESRRAL